MDIPTCASREPEPCLREKLDLVIERASANLASTGDIKARLLGATPINPAREAKADTSTLEGKLSVLMGILSDTGDFLSDLLRRV